ncbi:hypothetical protein HanRHA438_Chr11g0512691 [Helianthus annuus]|uniref:Uncharacterized protein n=1 Tax=Helianthus annuus TaxID=4232 RepID=A0A251TGG6_HELAN|nr:uncharacterized protein LOC110884308 [Helianthus annuus]KAF5782765.1 hypothetical protein HanXRQr2_Chr11g0499941 [Helianthus annuus]KAJ0502224.1 hypothetical protein HanHA300_Chr11g0410351 [Helianthus annuus]KAJ0510218.1 hypothetical protein HanIR_Chr11g0538231 [Helianthus annuus]KAJ0518147.1 hypothetical protein HanHA89_Chr11g0434041 [Helianthus annuus]KAJ0686175.1 hypothetical protein HanLR1_Chr11g0411651 [Helianthus annuus]
MAQIVSISHPNLSKTLAIGSRVDAQSINFNRRQQISHSWSSLQRDLKSNGKVYCLFSDNRSKDQAKKALESALGGKKIEFEKWDKEIKKREEAGGGGGGGGGWWRRWFGGSDGEHFWHEAQQVGLTLLALVVAFLILAKGDVLFAVLLNPLLFTLRGPRNGFRYIVSKIRRQVSPSASTSNNVPKQESYARTSAKESVASKWAS